MRRWLANGLLAERSLQDRQAGRGEQGPSDALQRSGQPGAWWRSGAMPQQAEARANQTTPTMKIFLRPNRSPSDPPSRMKAARVIEYPVTTHCKVPIWLWNERPMAGRAMPTTVESRVAMPEPRTVAAMTQRPRAVSVREPFRRLVVAVCGRDNSLRGGRSAAGYSGSPCAVSAAHRAGLRPGFRPARGPGGERPVRRTSGAANVRCGECLGPQPQRPSTPSADR